MPNFLPPSLPFLHSYLSNASYLANRGHCDQFLPGELVFGSIHKHLSLPRIELETKTNDTNKKRNEKT